MGKYNQYQREYTARDHDPQASIHPVWRGLGFIWMIGVPVFSYFLGVALIAENAKQNWIGVPSEYLVNFYDPYVLVKIGLTIILSVLLFALISLIGVFFFQVGGHKRYGPLDAPPERRNARKKY